MPFNPDFLCPLSLQLQISQEQRVSVCNQCSIFNIQVKDKHKVHMMHGCMVTTHGVFQLLGGVETKDT